MKENKKEQRVERVGKVKHRFNFVDVILILFVLLIVGLCFYFLSPVSWVKSLVAGDMRTVEYTVEFVGVDEMFIQEIEENDEVMSSVSKANLGTVTVVDAHTKQTLLEFDEETRAGVLVEHPKKYNVLVTIRTECSYDEQTGHTVNGQRIAVGEKLSLRFPDFVSEGYCIGYNVVD